MRPCPFCNKKVELRYPALIYVEELKKWTFIHHCNDSRMVYVSADTTEGIVAEWNGDHEE